MRSKIIFILQLLILFSCQGQNTGNDTVEDSIVKSVTIQQIMTDTLGIVYFSEDNGNTWKNESSGIPQNVSIGLGGITSSDSLLGISTKEYGVFIYNLKDHIWSNIPTEQQIIDSNPGAIIHFKKSLYVGTQSKGIFISRDNGENWETQNAGLGNLTIRRFLYFGNKLYVCTNDGFYLFDEETTSWKLEYGGKSLQVNGATLFRESIYIATNLGIFKQDTDQSWKNVLPKHSVHNISSDSEQLYGMTYTNLLLSSKDGINWKSMQDGLPKDLYTFNILRQNDTVFAGQWDGIYRKTKNDLNWKQSSNGLPSNFAVTNLISFNGVLVITTSERNLKSGETIEK